MTRRQEIAEILRSEALSLQDLSVFLKVHIKVILDDIPHVEKSVQPEQKLIIVPAAVSALRIYFQREAQDKDAYTMSEMQGHVDKAAALSDSGRIKHAEERT